MNRIGNEHRRQRKGHRDDRETDLLGPASAASSGFSPCSMWRTMFSSITMASSTTKPMERISAIIEMLLMLKSSRYITENVPTMENGSAMAGNHGGRDIPQEQENHQDHQPQRGRHGELDVLESLANVLGAVAANAQVDGRRHLRLEDGKQALMSSVTSMVLLPGCRITWRLTPRTPCVPNSPP